MTSILDSDGKFYGTALTASRLRWARWGDGAYILLTRKKNSKIALYKGVAMDTSYYSGMTIIAGRLTWVGQQQQQHTCTVVVEWRIIMCRYENR